MAVFEFAVDIEDTNGNKLGSGPLASVDRWSYTARFDRAGSIAFSFAAGDAQAGIVQNRRIARAWARLDGEWSEVGAGVIDTLETAPGSDGRVTLAASGLDLTRELSYRGVGTLEVGRGSGATHAEAVAAVGALAPPGWSFTPSPAPGHDYIYARYDGESVLGALVYLAEKTGTHFVRSADRTLVFSSEFTPSGMRAIQASGDLSAWTCAITSLRRTVDTHDLLTRIHPYGSGQGNARLTLHASSRTALDLPSGYVLDKEANYLENEAATAQYGLIDFPQVEFKEITPIANTASDVRSAANMLCDAALAELRRRSSLASQQTYALSVAGCNRLLRPLQTLRVVYRDVEQGIDIDEDLYILEATWEMDSRGISTTRLVVSTDDRWPESDVQAAADRAVQGQVFQAHPQMGPNEWWENGTLFVGSDQANHVAEFPFVLGNALVTVEQVLFRYKVAQVLSFTSIVVGSANVEVTVDSVDVTVTGAINISHTHEIPDHEHTTNVVNDATPDRNLGFDIFGDFGILVYDGADAGTIDLHTTPGGGNVATSESGGDETLELDGVTGGGTGSGTLDLSEAIGVSYGVYRAPAAKTYLLDELEYSVNGGAWLGLDEGLATGDGYYQVDITPDIQDADTFRPLHENNVVEVRRKGGAGGLALEGVNGDGTRALVSTNPVEHGLTVGEQVTISGNGTYDGTYIIDEVVGHIQFYILHGSSGIDLGGTLELNKTAMVLAKLGVRCTIQATGYTA